MYYSERIKRRLNPSGPGHIYAKSFDVLVDPQPKDGGDPVIGLQVEPVAGSPFILPIAFESAREIAEMMLKTLMCAKPEMFFPKDLVKQYRAGRLSFEQLVEKY
ncbi:hypothetical protein MFM001_24570 [Mycobacterium sp. MFM001]|uniref:hypothetical protein n=1 Tax=Mycobacterium sp. MFM001 TaxID=2049453 RepID=UPI000DA4349D|nr:hypothetical protein [Mycobacterium sp. MFM001]GBE65995.1 hypothetical protein MFM001_24570 [Mycobacterium sp. MFM001]